MLHYYHAILLGFTFVFFRNKSKDETTYYILHTTLSALKTIENKSEKMLNLREKKLILLQHYIIITYKPFSWNQSSQIYKNNKFQFSTQNNQS